jgi:hypothetical protein
MSLRNATTRSACTSRPANDSRQNPASICRLAGAVPVDCTAIAIIRLEIVDDFVFKAGQDVFLRRRIWHAILVTNAKWTGQ